MWSVLADRLARWANRRHPDGTPVRGARQAWTILVTAADAGDRVAGAALRRAWLRDPRDDTWERVKRWCTPADVLSAAVDPRRDAGARAAIGAFCLRHELFPDNAVERAVFFVLTGQRERYEAADPDGTLLAGAYRGATEPTRKALRHHMVGAGELDLARVIADRPDRTLSEDEADYLARQLAGTGEWARLWRLIPTMPLAGATRAARLFRDWRPDDDLGRAYLTRLAGTDPDLITACRQAVVTRLDIHSYREGSIALDNSEIAVVPFRGRAKVFALPGGHVLDRFSEEGWVLALGGTTIVMPYSVGPHRLMRYTPGRPPEVLLRDQERRLSMKRTPGGFVVTSEAGDVWFGGASGPWSRVTRVELLGGDLPSRMRLMGTDPVSGQIALAIENVDQGDLVVVDADLRPLARTQIPYGAEAAFFFGPERILVWHRGHPAFLQAWRRDGDDLVPVAKVEVDGRKEFLPMPALDLLAMRGLHDLSWLDASTLAPVDRLAGLLPEGARLLSLSTDSSLLAAATGDGVEVHDLTLRPLVPLITRSLATLSPKDMETIGALENRTFAPRVRDVMELLRVGLEYRFGTDVALSENVPIAGRADDIALGGGD